jgi:hypothetical protein
MRRICFGRFESQTLHMAVDSPENTMPGEFVLTQKLQKLFIHAQPRQFGGFFYALSMPEAQMLVVLGGPIRRTLNISPKSTHLLTELYF